MSSIVGDIVRQRLMSGIKWALLLVFLGWLLRRRPAEHWPRYEFSLVLPGMLGAWLLWVYLQIGTGRDLEMGRFPYDLVALPWAGWFATYSSTTEPSWAVLAIGWLINAALLFAFGFWIDHGLWLRRRRRLRGLSKGQLPGG